MAWWKFFENYSITCIVECVPENKKKTRRQKAKETKEENGISVENLMRYNNVCEFALTYLTVSLISPDCSYEFNVVFVQREKSQHLCYYNNIWSKQFQKQK